MQASVRIGWKVLFAMGIYALAISVLWMFLTEWMFVSDFEAYTGQSLSDALAGGSKSAELFLISKRLLGLEMFLASLLIILIAKMSYSRGEKWSWYALLIAGTITWGSMIGYRIAIGYVESVGIVPPIIGATLLVIGIALPAKAILGAKST